MFDDPSALAQSEGDSFVTNAAGNPVTEFLG
jgi:hypothetical protein